MCDIFHFMSDSKNFQGFLSNETNHCSYETQQEESLRCLEESAFVLAPGLYPEKFVTNLKKNTLTKSLTDFKKGTTTLAFVFQGGIIVAADSRASMGSYIASQSVRKIIEINSYLLGTMAGGAADCSFWERHLAKLCRIYELQNNEKIPVASASNLLANIFFQYRRYGLSCGTMIAGCDHTGPQLYFVDDTGTRVKGNLFSVGSGSTYAYGVLDSEYHFDISLKDATELAKKAIYHATHRDAASGGVVRVYHVHSQGWTKLEDGKDVNELHYEYAAAKNCVGTEL
ncbi:uncharacterized protein LOC128884106 [Hylaeus volcanicus]|uniref:uncharacterized protein LOC128884106 n=1 Tax=Hylaeus volcanicus TaxID=313075 RepID=UPI0023B832F0|nr:uncharacterized protein LOC128884106 [Hylaeus volcanicus]